MRFGFLTALTRLIFTIGIFTIGATAPAFAQISPSFKTDELSCAAVYQVAGGVAQHANAADAAHYADRRNAVAGAFQSRTGASPADLQKAIEVRVQSLTKTLGAAGPTAQSVQPYVGACDARFH